MKISASLREMSRRISINIDKSQLQTLWYENKDGDKYMSKDILQGAESPPEGYVYQVSQFPTTLHHNVLRTITQEDVMSCIHPDEYVQPTYGWIDGIEGRECKQCHGDQTRNVGEEWPSEWSFGGSYSVMSGECGWPEDLALAMANSGEFTLSEAILVAANNCERCMNALAHQYGLDWGYPEYGDEWQKCETGCEFCE